MTQSHSETGASLIEEIELLRAENARLLGLLDRHGIAHAVEVPSADAVAEPPGIAYGAPSPSRPTTTDKVALFRRLFRGREDVFPVRWENNRGQSGYAPACGNEWKPGVCQKPKVKCSECLHQRFLPVNDLVIYNHLAGQHTIGIYPLLPNDTCYFVAVDFDDNQWRDDAHGFVRSCRELQVPVALEVSRSGNGAHAWIFFSDAVPARDARRLCTALISHTCTLTRQLNLSSYDRLFPNQDTMPKGGFGNLIALPLQKAPRERGCSVFVDDDLTAYPDQWAFLAMVVPIPQEALESAITRAAGNAHPLDVAFISDEDQREPWNRPALPLQRLPPPLPETIAVTLANQLYVEKAGLPQPLVNRLVRLAAFQNPEFYKAQAMRLPVWDKPRVIGCAENYPQHIALPRGCLDDLQKFLRSNGIGLIARDERSRGRPIHAAFIGSLGPDQEKAIGVMLESDLGVLCAPTAFGKTVVAAAIIARRLVNTLVLVHRTELLKQWQERLRVFLDLGAATVGTIGGGKHAPSGAVDIAVMQSLSRKGEIADLTERYGQIIVDECHHLSAASFEAILKRAKARYVMGLTATPQRRDGQHPIIFMQCGPIRYTAPKPAHAPHALAVLPQFLATPLDGLSTAGIQDVFRQLAADSARTARIGADIRAAYHTGRHVIVLTERTDHLKALHAELEGAIDKLFVLHGRMARKERDSLLKSLEALPSTASRVLLATGRLVGEGFDHPPLDTLILAMPISWRGTLQQYAGRLHRVHATKTDVRVYDYIDGAHPALLRMWDKRQRGYRAMGYRVGELEIPPSPSVE